MRIREILFSDLECPEIIFLSFFLPKLLKMRNLRFFFSSSPKSYPEYEELDLDSKLFLIVLDLDKK